MIILTQSTPDGLQITLASYSHQEIGDALKLLEKAGQFRLSNPTKIDKAGRQIDEIYISKVTAARLGRLLGGTFSKNGQFTAARTPGGRRYACREVTSRGHGHCEEITATDQATAIFKCALIAGRNAWFGGVASVGSCK
jgi:hypothetical protein